MELTENGGFSSIVQPKHQNTGLPIAKDVEQT